MQLPSNISLLAACLKKAKHEVRLFDTTLYRTSERTLDEMRIDRLQVDKIKSENALIVKSSDVFEDFKDVVEKYKPDLIGVSVVDSTVKLGLDLIKTVKHKNIPTIFGGKYATFNPEGLIKDADILCVGDGEEAIVELCNCLQNKVSYDSILNLWIKKQDGTVIKNKLRKPSNLDMLPFEDFSIFETKRLLSPMRGKMLSMIPINLDRGCPYRCSFCGAPQLSDLYKVNEFQYCRQKSIDRIYQELKYQISTYKVSYLYFNSEIFLNMPVKKLRQFAEMYAEFQLPFWCQTRIETLTDEKVQILKSMNCDRVAIGIDHGNEEFRKKLLHKNFSNTQIIKAFDLLNKYNLRIGVNIMLGFPDETRDLVFDSINLSRKLKFNSINGFTFQPYHGSALRHYCIESGYLAPDHLGTIDSSIMGSSPLDMTQFSKSEIEGLLRTFVLYVRLPESYYPEIKIAEQLTEEGNVALHKLKKIYCALYSYEGNLNES